MNNKIDSILLPKKDIVIPTTAGDDGTVYKRKTLMESRGGAKKDGKEGTGGGPKFTRILMRNLDTGKERVLHNKVTVSGAQFTASKHWDLDPIVDFPTYNDTLSLDNSVSKGSTPLNTPKICLFCAGNGGCGTEMSQVYDVDYTKRIQPEHLIPFRYQVLNNDLSAEMRKVYFGRKETADRIAYYFKAFDTEPMMHGRYIDGTVIDENIYDSENTMEAELYVETTLRVTKEDFRDYYIATTGIETAVLNQISLLTGWYTEDEGIKWYQDVAPITQLNIANEPLIDLTKGIEFVYQIYY